MYKRSFENTRSMSAKKKCLFDDDDDDVDEDEVDEDEVD